MTEYTLEQIKSYKPPKKLHPIAGLTYDLYDAGGFKLDDAAIAKVRAELQTKYGDLKELTDALCGLAAFIMFAMEVKNDPVAAEAIANLIKETKSQYEPLGRSLASLLQDMASKATGLFEKLTDRHDEAKAKAPVFGEAPPPGARPLSAIKPLAEPPVIKTKTLKTAAPKKKK